MRLLLMVADCEADMGIFKKLLGGKKPDSGKEEGERRPDAKAVKKKAPKGKAAKGKTAKGKAAKANSPNGKESAGKGDAAASSETSRPLTKTASADAAEMPMSPEEIIREAMRIRKKKLADAAANDAEREDREVFAKEVESFIENEEDDEAEKGEGEQSAKAKNEEIILAAMKLRKKRIDEEKQAAEKAAAKKKKAASAEPKAEKPDDREELIRKALQIREEKQDLLGDIDPELREKLSQAVMAKFTKIKGGDW